MKSSRFEIRSANSADYDRILAVHRDAFGVEEGDVIACLVAQMLQDPSAEPSYSFVAEQCEQIVGHVLFTAVLIEPSDVSAQILAPLAVVGDHQGSGIGTKLVEEAFVTLKSNGVEVVFVLGDPEYYSRFGLVPAGVRGFQAPYPIASENADAWMVKELKPRAIDRCAGTVRCCSSLDHPHYWQQ